MPFSLRTVSLSRAVPALVPVLAWIAFVGCASPQAAVTGKETPKETSAYVSAIFYKTGDPYAGNFGLGLVEMATGKEVLFSMFEDHLFGALKVGKVPALRMIEIAPGTYQLKFWATWANDRSGYKKIKFSETKAPIEFTVKPGRVTYFGKYEAHHEITSRTYNTVTWRNQIIPQATSLADLKAMITTDYPEFPFERFDPVQFNQQ